LRRDAERATEGRRRLSCALKLGRHDRGDPGIARHVGQGSRARLALARDRDVARTGRALGVTHHEHNG
jgi:hypothetical protein